jgi:hypothetical protein
MEVTAPVAEAQTAEPQGAEEAKAQPDVESILKSTKHRVKVDGEELELDYDELKRRASHSSAADKRMQAAAEGVKLAKAIQEGDYGQVIKKIGYDNFKKLAESVILAELEFEQMNADQQKAYELEQELNQRKAADKEREEQSKAEQWRAAVQSAAESIDKDIETALKSINRKPTAKLVYLIAQEMERALVDRQPITATEAINRLQGTLKDAVPDWLNGLSIEDARKLLPDLLAKLRQSEIEAVRQQDPLRSRRNLTQGNSSSQKKQKQKVGLDSWFSKIEKTL